MFIQVSDIAVHVQIEGSPGSPPLVLLHSLGTSLHVSGRDVAALEASIAPWRDNSDLHWHKSAPSLEDVFIELMSRSKDNFQG